jgi:hypothetical protein
MLQTWIDNQENADLARLFTEGGARASDLLAACQSNHDQIVGAAFQILELIEAPGLATCADLLERRRGVLLHPTGPNLSPADVERIDHWLAQKRTPDGYGCGEKDDSDIDDALVYSLILDGSALSKSLLVRMRAFAKLCTAGDTLWLIEDADSLIAAARKIGHDVKIEPDIGESIRASAFFLPPESRKGAEVVVIARTDNRILLTITYRVGFKGGGTYCIVLRKDGSGWQYALIRKWAAF